MNLKDKLTPAHLTGMVDTILMSVLRNVLIARDLTSQLGKTLEHVARARELRARHFTFHHDQPMVSSPVNDNYYVNAPVYTGLLTGSKETVNVYQSPGTLTLTIKTIEPQTQHNRLQV